VRLRSSLHVLFFSLYDFVVGGPRRAVHLSGGDCVARGCDVDPSTTPPGSSPSYAGSCVRGFLVADSNVLSDCRLPDFN
jgi:hypothetical protein